MRGFTTLLAAILWLVCTPSVVFAQAALTGVVRDTSGAVLPGVTVEASSPALIEKVRVAVTDGTGQYRIVDLRPGAYTVTFTLTGFNTVRRDGIELAGSFTATINAEMRVGAVEETITVIGEVPIVDVQSTTRQRVMGQDEMGRLPIGRVWNNLPALIPGVTAVSGAAGLLNQDVGGTLGESITELTVHGSKGTDMRQTFNGIPIGSTQRGGAFASMAPNMGSLQEVTVDTSSVSAELGQGGVRVNFIPREGGNTLRGSIFFSGANGDMQWDNVTQELRDRGLTTPNSLKKVVDFNPAAGGPIARDRLWYWAAGRYYPVQNFVAGMFANRNANNPDVWTYEPDLSQPSFANALFWDTSLRLTWQASQKNKFNFFIDEQNRRTNPNVSPTTAPDAGGDNKFRPMRLMTAEWVNPLTNRVLLEANGFYRLQHWGTRLPAGVNRAMIAVNEQSTGVTYRGITTATLNKSPVAQFRFAASYVTGAHALKVGMNYGSSQHSSFGEAVRPFSYRLNRGVPNQISLNSQPVRNKYLIRADLGIYAQDRWTLNRTTLSYGLRFDYLNSVAPELTIGPAPLTPTRTFTFSRTPFLGWKDITPKLGVSYNLFGTGRTALKASLNKYVVAQAHDGTFGSALAPGSTLVTTTTRSWNDRNGNFVPDCNLVDPAANGECGRMANTNFGRTVTGTTVDPDLLRGWGKREYNWEVSAGIQHEIVPRVSVDVGYFRRWFGNFAVTDNLALGPDDFDRFSITAPTDPRLPGGGGFAITDLYNVKPERFGVPADNFLTFAKNYGEQIRRWHGFDVTANARLQSGLTLQGGVSTGKTTTDDCDVVSKLDNPSTRFCHVETPFLTQVKGFGFYTIPRIDVQVSGTWQSLPGLQVAANFNAPNALVAPSLGRNLSGSAANVTVNLIEPGTMYGDRVNQIDFRVGKLVRIGQARAALNFDLYNMLNGSAVLRENSNFAVWRQPQALLDGRLAKVTVQLDF